MWRKRWLTGCVPTCMLAYYVGRHMRQALAPILFDDHDHVAVQRESTCAGDVGAAIATRNARHFKSCGIEVINPWTA